MAPIKFEKKIKELFEAREIKPSEDAWERVVSELGSAPAKRSLRPWHYWIAASIVFIVFVTGWSVQKSDQPAIEENPIVEQQITPEPQNSQSVVPINQEQEDVKAIHEDTPRAEVQVHDLVSSPEQTYRLAENIEDHSAIEAQWEEGGQDLLDEKTSEVVAQVDQMEAINTEVTEAELDSILKAAQESLLTSREFQEETQASGTSLLAEVEGEMDASFREQVFDKLKKGFIKVKTAVADRNN